MPASASARLNGVPLPNTQECGWTYKSGVDPHMRKFEFSSEYRDHLIISSLGAATLEVVDGGGSTLKVEKLIRLGEVPASQPYFSAVLVADQRWMWPRRHVIGRYNIRRKANDRRILLDGAELSISQPGGGGGFEVLPSVDEYKFAPFSLKNGLTRWRPKEVLEDVLRKIGQKFRWNDNPTESAVNDLVIDDTGSAAVRIALRYLPGMDIYIDQKGIAVIYNRMSRKEGNRVEKSGGEMRDMGHAQRVSFAPTRPREIHVLFTREHELRFDSLEEDAEEVTYNGRWMQNVLRSPDPLLAYGDSLVTRGTWVTVDNAIRAFNADGNLAGSANPLLGPDLSHAIIRGSFFSDLLLNQYLRWGQQTQSGNPIWGPRISALKQHYRQTFRINKYWMDRIVRLSTQRPAIIDPVTGTRGIALVYVDYGIRSSTRGIALAGRDMYENWDSNISASTDPLSEGYAAPCIVSLLDHDNGVMHFDFKTDLYGWTKQVFPSALTGLGATPIGDIGTLNYEDEIQTMTNEDGEQYEAFAGLSEEYFSSVVVSAVPAAPNSSRQLYRVKIKPEDTREIIGDVGECNGPIMELRIGAGLLTAQFAWSDDPSMIENIEEVFKAHHGFSNSDNMDVSLDEVLTIQLLNDQHVTSVARAAAAAVWNRMKDRYLGRKSVRMYPQIQPIGSINSVTHRVDTRGETTTSMEMMEQLPQQDMFPFLPESVRAFILREVG